MPQLSYVRVIESKPSETFQSSGICKDGDATDRNLDCLIDKTTQRPVRLNQHSLLPVRMTTGKEWWKGHSVLAPKRYYWSVTAVESNPQRPKLVSMVRVACQKTERWRSSEAAAGRRCVSVMSRRGRESGADAKRPWLLLNHPQVF
jgi:hypothetical protein